jgi:NTE family protein
MTNSNSLKYSCIFGGGAVRGMAYVGIIKALEQLQIATDDISGSSVGAIFAGLFSLGYTAEELREIFMQVNFELFKDIHFGFGKDFAISKGEIFLEWLRELIEKKYYGDKYNKEGNKPVTFADLEKNLVVITTDLTNFSYKEFSKFVTPDFEVAYAIRISATMPGLMKPVENEGTLLVDGDLQKSLPLWKLSENLCPEDARVLEFRLEGDFAGKDLNAIDYINTVYSCVNSIATDFIIDTYGYRDKFDYIKVNTGSVLIVNFNIPQDKREELMDAGYLQTIDYFKNLLPEKKKKILKHYKNIRKHLDHIKKSVSLNKIRKARDEMGVLYMEIASSKNYIDRKYYNMIELFKDNFLSNITPASFFGIFALREPKLIQTQINFVVDAYEEKILELESYIFGI